MARGTGASRDFGAALGAATTLLRNCSPHPEACGVEKRGGRPGPDTGSRAESRPGAGVQGRVTAGSRGAGQSHGREQDAERAASRRRGQMLPSPPPSTCPGKTQTERQTESVHDIIGSPRNENQEQTDHFGISGKKKAEASDC